MAQPDETTTTGVPPADQRQQEGELTREYSDTHAALLSCVRPDVGGCGPCGPEPFISLSAELVRDPGLRQPRGCPFTLTLRALLPSSLSEIPSKEFAAAFTAVVHVIKCALQAGVAVMLVMATVRRVGGGFLWLQQARAPLLPQGIQRVWLAKKCWQGKWRGPRPHLVMQGVRPTWPSSASLSLLCRPRWLMRCALIGPRRCWACCPALSFHSPSRR